MKKKLLVLGAIVCLVAILAAGTLAYFTSHALVHNVITSGEIDISVVENVPDGTPIYKDGELTGYRLQDVMPDTSVEKDVKIRNEVQEPAWVRVRLKHTIQKNGEDLPEAVDGVEMIQYNVTEKWIEKDGWYYYTEPLDGKADSESVIKTVYFAKEMNNDYQNCTVELSVEAQAVQVKNNPIPAGGDVTNIPGWPTT